MSYPRLIAWLLALITLLAYLPVTRHDFINYDDNDYVTDNRVVQNGLTLAGMKWAFTTGHAANWHPVTWLSHMTDCELFKLNAGPHHFVNVIFHAANTALLFILLLRLTKKIQPSALVAALFAWHPLHVESVAWIAERKDVLSTFFALLTLLSYAKSVQENSGRHFWFALFFFTLGLMSKPMLVTLPFILLLLDYWPLQRFEVSGFKFQFLLEKIPFFLLTAASCVITLLVQQPAMISLDGFPLRFRVENSVVTTAQYLLKIFWPAHLSVFYPFTKISGPTLALALAALIVFSTTAWLVRTRSRCWIVGWLWFLGTLIPVIGLVQVGSAAMADRYTYIPSIGIFMAFVFGLHELGERFSWPGQIFQVISIAVLIVSLGLLENQLRFWRDGETLFRHAVAVTKNNDTAHDNLGVTLEQQGRAAEALDEYREALRINPYHHQLSFSIGSVLEKMGRPAEALEEYRQCIRLDPQIPFLHNAAGSALSALGKSDDALKEFAEAGRLDPHYATPHIETAKILFAHGRDAEAAQELRIAAQAEPHSFQILTTVAHYLAANAADDARDGQTALVLALRANDLADSREPLVFDVLGMAFAETGDFTNAATCAQSALELASTAKLKNSDAIHQRLKLYKVHQPWRESFRATNAPGKN